MKIAIVGAGLTGAYLYRLLDKRAHTIDLFDRRPATRCGITPCAWGASRDFFDLVRASGLDGEDYVLTRSDHLVMDGLTIKAEFVTFDKEKLIRDLLQGATINGSGPAGTHYDRIIDATGVARSLLPPISDDVVLPCVQYRVKTAAPLENRITLRGIGYAWSFPLSRDEYHIGCGSLLLDPATLLDDLGWVGENPSRGKVLCGCKGSIRLTGPHDSQPFVTDAGGCEIWGVGEAIGCVAPLAGDGNVPGMRSVQLLLEWWENPTGYGKALLHEFGWMRKQRDVIDKLRNKKRLGLKDAWVLKQNSRRMAIDVGIKEAAALLKQLR